MHWLRITVISRCLWRQFGVIGKFVSGLEVVRVVRSEEESVLAPLEDEDSVVVLDFQPDCYVRKNGAANSPERSELAA